MQKHIAALYARMKRRDTALLVVLGAVFFLAVVAVSWIKRATLSYNALDLGIFQQVIRQSAQGHLYGLSIHPHVYLGDHIDFSLLALLPFALIWKSPMMLLTVQAAALALALWPLTILTRRHLPHQWALLLGFVYSTNMLVHGSALFEFHSLTFLLPLLLWAIVLYEQSRGWLYALVLTLALLVREDVGLLVAGMGLMAWADTKPKRWRLLPLLCGIAWSITGGMATGFFNHDRYKFLAYFGWLGDSPLHIMERALTHPWVLLMHLFSIQTVFFGIAIFLTFAGIPLLASRRLLGCALFFVVFALTGSGTGEIALRAHYAVVFVPFLFWASILGLERLLKSPPHWLQTRFGQPQHLGGALLVITTLYGLASWSALQPVAVWRLAQKLHDPVVRVSAALEREVPQRAHLAASFAFLPDFGELEQLYSLHYAFAGHRQLSSLPYALPKTTDWILFDTTDALMFEAQYQRDPDVLASGPSRLRALLARGFSPVARIDSFLILKKTGTAQPLFQTGAVQEGALTPQTTSTFQLVAVGGTTPALATTRVVVHGESFVTLPLSLTWKITAGTKISYHFSLQFVDSTGKIRASRRYPVAYGFFPTTEWTPNIPVETSYAFLVPNLPHGTYTAQIQPEVFQHPYLTLGPTLSAIVATEGKESVGSPVSLGTLTL